MALVLDGDGTITGIAEGGLNDGIITTAEIKDANITAAKLDGAQSGSAPIYAARAWVNFNGTGTVAIRASGNVTSITDNGTGDYTVNFTTAMPDADYSTVISGARGAANDDFISLLKRSGTYSTSAVQVISMAASQDGIFVDANPLNVAIFR
jgi:hypothetical protein